MWESIWARLQMLTLGYTNGILPIQTRYFLGALKRASKCIAGSTAMLAVQTPNTSSNDTLTRLGSLATPMSDGAIGKSVMDAQIRIVARKEHVFLEGDNATHVFKVESGHVCIYRMLADGRRQIVDFAFAGDFIGLGASAQHSMNAQATEQTRLRCLPTSELRNVIRDSPALGLELYHAISSELSATRELLVSVCQRTAQERVAGFLLALSDRNARRGEDASTIVLPMTRTDIADYLGLTIETVSRSFSRMRKNAIIDIEQCILITIIDSDALAEIAAGVCA
jgi:CRP/FNR family transcriptional regulator, anaerobic regulatory protein